MKLAYTVATREVESRVLAWQGDVAEVAAALKGMGYDGVELFVRDPAEAESARVEKILRGEGLAVAAVGTGPVAVEDGLTFTAESAEVRRRAVERAGAVVEFAARWGAQVNIGKLRGNVGAGGERAGWRDEGLQAVCRRAEALGITVTLEPQHRGIIDNVHTVGEALAVARRLGCPNLQVMADTFHMEREETEPWEAVLAKAGEALRHVHLADVGRRVPGAGTIDFAGLARTLGGLGYEQFLTVEVAQEPDSAAAARAAAEFWFRLMGGEAER